MNFVWGYVEFKELGGTLTRTIKGQGPIEDHTPSGWVTLSTPRVVSFLSPLHSPTKPLE